jgi:hypothetical protein
MQQKPGEQIKYAIAETSYPNIPTDFCQLLEVGGDQWHMLLPCLMSFSIDEYLCRFASTATYTRFCIFCQLCGCGYILSVFMCFPWAIVMVRIKPLWSTCKRHSFYVNIVAHERFLAYFHLVSSHTHDDANIDTKTCNQLEFMYCFNNKHW